MLNTDESSDKCTEKDNESDWIDQDMHEIIPNLYVGDYFSVKFMTEGSREKIRRIVNTAEEIQNVANFPADCYLHLPLKDDCSFEDTMRFNDYMRPFIQFMGQKELSESPVLIHCQMGVSRSCSMAAVYILHKGYVKTFDEAVKFIVRKRPQAFSGGINRVYALPIIERYEDCT